MDEAKAEDFCRSYGAAMAAKDPKALVDHYGFPYISFTLGYVSSFEERADADESVATHVARFERRGLGTDIRLKEFSVDTVMENSALCKLTWEIHPKDGTPGWSWQNVYGLRATPERMYFEFNISDEEIGKLYERFPDFMTS